MPLEESSSSREDPESDEGGEPPDAESVASRAAGRPPEEASSDNPEAQAQTILEESEERIVDGAHAADPIDVPFPKPSEDQLEEEGAD
jgi:hypothetical protein